MTSLAAEVQEPIAQQVCFHLQVAYQWEKGCFLCGYDLSKWP